MPANNAPSKLWYLNADFDLRFTGADLSPYRDYFKEMTAWIIPVAEKSDRVILDCKVHDSYLAHLAGLGLGVSSEMVVAGKGDCNGFTASAWGWNDPVRELFREYRATVDAPASAIVRKVNSREFSFALGEKSGLGVPGGELFHSLKEANVYLEKVQDFPVVIKPDFGNSGIGFSVMKSTADLERAKGQAAKLFESGQPCVVIEPWHQRVADLSSRFEVDKSGTLSALEHYRTLTTSNGAFYGMEGDPDHSFINPWRSRLREAAEMVAQALFAEGYFGPVSIDSMIIRNNNGEEELVPLLEINARQGMSLLALRLRDRLAEGRCWRFRSVGRKRVSLPDSYSTWYDKISTLAYYAKSRCGAALITPLRVDTGNGMVEPNRTLLFLAAESKEELDSLDRDLTQCISPPLEKGRSK